MKKTLFCFLMVGLAFTALQVATAQAAPSTGVAEGEIVDFNSELLPASDSSAAPIGEGGEGGGPSATDMSGNMINDGGHGANSAKERKEAAIAKCLTQKAYNNVTGKTEYDEEHCEQIWQQFVS